MTPEDAIEQIIVKAVAPGRVPDVDFTIRTPGRWIRAMEEMLGGYGDNPQDYLSTVFDTGSGGAVVVDGIRFTSVCEHHLLPFFGEVTVAYMPDGKVVGLSKVARTVDILSRRLQMQERLTSEIANAIFNSKMKPFAVGVRVKARHTCLCSRGIRALGVHMTTRTTLGRERGDESILIRYAPEVMR